MYVFSLLFDVIIVLSRGSAGHHRAYEKGVLHRDVSVNNLMFRQKDNKTSGVMNDWDLSALLDANKQVEKSLAKFRTGTLPFLATTLLVEEKEGDKPILPYHAYHHDLESFFYVLVWAGLHFHLNGTKINADVHDKVKSWTSDMETARTSSAAAWRGSLFKINLHRYARLWRFGLIPFGRFSWIHSGKLTVRDVLHLRLDPQFQNDKQCMKNALERI
jgi:hypothetical protein